jgi:hypothetical protein
MVAALYVRGFRFVIRDTMEIVEEEHGPEGRRISLVFNWNGASVPAVLLLPNAADRAAAALLLHGFSLTKEHLRTAVASKKVVTN